MPPFAPPSTIDSPLITFAVHMTYQSVPTFVGTNVMPGDRAKWVFEHAGSCDSRYDATVGATVDDGNCTDAPPCPDSNGDGAIGALEVTDLLVYYNTDGGGCGNLNPLTPTELGVAPCDLPGVDCGDEGCTYPNALNFDPGASVDDGSCFWTGCTDPTMQNYQPLANLDDGTCVAPICWDFDFNGSVGIQDLLDLLLVVQVLESLLVFQLE